MEYTSINEHIHRTVMPYKDIFTTVYTVEYDGGAILFDVATYESDVEDYIVPMIRELGLEKKLKYLFISHNHGDHAGGIPYLLRHYPNICILTRSPDLCEKYKCFNVRLVDDGEMIDGIFSVISIPGHTLDSAALYDSRTKIMITGDSLQLYGIFGSQDWGSNIALAPEHIAAIAKLRKMDIEAIYTAHDFHPYGYAYIGRESIGLALDDCVNPLLNIKKLIADNPALSDSEIREMYNSSAKIPPVREGVFTKMRAVMELL